MRENSDFREYYQIVAKIAEGLYGVVYKVILKETSEVRAIKIYDKNNIKKNFIKEKNYELAQKEMEKYINNYLSEVKIMKILEGKNKQNINTIKFYEYFNTKDEFAIVMELSDDNLKNLNNNNLINEEEIYEILTQLNNTFKIMSKNRIIHRLICLHNVLIKKENSRNIYKLTSYGLSKQLIDEEALFEFVGVLNYMSPEILNGEIYNEKTDLWSLGVLIYSLLFKELPYTGENESELYKNIKESEPMYLKDNKNSDLIDLIKKLLTVDHNKRLSWDEYFRHPYFTKRGTPNIISYEDKNEIYNLRQQLKDEINKNNKLTKKINQLITELKEEKYKNKKLEEKLSQFGSQSDIKSTKTFSKNDNIYFKESLYMNIIDKDNEIKELKKKLSRFPFELNEGEQLMTVIFTSFEQNLKYFSVICKNTDIFNVLEKKLYEEYNEYYNTNNVFTVNGIIIQKYKSLDYNNIHNNAVIMMSCSDIY